MFLAIKGFNFKMKKIDLHIHTIATRSDANFDFSFEQMKEYVESEKIDCVAITNHNLFDLKQYKTISKGYVVMRWQKKIQPQEPKIQKNTCGKLRGDLHNCPENV